MSLAALLTIFQSTFIYGIISFLSYPEINYSNIAETWEELPPPVQIISNKFLADGKTSTDPLMDNYMSY